MSLASPTPSADAASTEPAWTGPAPTVIPLLLVATVWYVILTSLLSVGQYYVERYYARGAERTLPPTPFQRARQAVAQ